MTDTITLSQLEALDACESQLDLFREYFPSGKVRVTIKRAVALADVFDWDWAARHLLTAEARRDYEAATEEAWRVFETAKDEARRIYRAATAEAARAYQAATAEAARAYLAAEAEAFAHAYLSQ